MFVEIGIRDTIAEDRNWLLANGWRNIVVDVLPGTIDELRRITQQRVYSLNSCVSLSGGPAIRRFTEHSYYTPRFDLSLNSILAHFRPHTYAYTPCFTLNTIFSAFGLRQIDFLSLDVNGGEQEIVDKLDYDRVAVKFLRVRQSIYEKRRDFVIKTMVRKGFVFQRQIDSDLFFALKNL